MSRTETQRIQRRRDKPAFSQRNIVGRGWLSHTFLCHVIPFGYGRKKEYRAGYFTAVSTENSLLELLVSLYPLCAGNWEAVPLLSLCSGLNRTMG